MPRDSNGVVSWPVGTDGGPPNTPISSIKYNSFRDDLKAILNGILPLSRGGTGGSTAAAARTSMKVPVSSTRTTDPNSITETGFYTAAPNTPNTPFTNVAWHIEHSEYSSDNARQFASRVTQNAGIYTRVRTAPGAWENWGKVWSSFDLVDTAVLGGGFPVGGIFERGSNGNGDYIRFADGTQQCWGSVTVNPAPGPNSPMTALVTFPKPFVSGSSPILQVTPRTTGPGTTVLGVSYVPVDEATAAIWATRSNTSATAVSWFATGRWA